ncbi:hypothetical protein BGX21_006737 [Mortierella sp. AD011]|nr:hypothetical protein BGX20_008568 [Mortierella sp. AD010]KAF9399150.1 hypothetical protein BGX21_006737 [Mortierella sp. AD011]
MADEQGITRHQSGSTFNQEIQETSVVRTYYEDDVDDDEIRGGLWNRGGSEQARLINTGGAAAAAEYVVSQRLTQYQNGSYHSLHTLLNKPLQEEGGLLEEQDNDNDDDRQKGTLIRRWIEWAVKNGLHPSTWTRQTYLKGSLLVILLTLIILAFTVLRVQDHVKDILLYIDEHRSMGAVLFVTFYTIACWLFLPGSLFTIGAGFLFKPMPFALAIVLLGDFLGALGTFLFGRYLFHDWVKGLMSKHPKFNALDEVIKDDGKCWKIVVMLRLTPIPFNLITYFFSITSISLYTLLGGTVAGVFPGSCLGIWIGSMLQGLSGIDNPDLEPKNVVILIMNGAFIVCSILTLSIFGKRSLRKALSKLDQHQGAMSSRARGHGEEEESEDDGHNRTEGNLETTAVDMTGANQTSSGAVASDAASTGFTRGEKWMFFGIVVVAIVNVSVSIPLYFHYANKKDE